VPAYNESDNLPPLLQRLSERLAGRFAAWEIIVVDDGSADESERAVAPWVTNGPIRYVSLSRNFGKEAALTAGLDRARGDVVLLLDADLQHPPALIDEMLAAWRGGADMVYTVRKSRADENWLKKTGTVGRGAIPGSVHICDDEGNELPNGEPGQVWFDAKATFTYHNDPEKTAKAYNDKGWTSLGDIGYLDDDGYLFLTDRVSHMIISGGVNIYPQEVENLLTMHPAVADVAVIGVPDPDMGEQVKAIVQPVDWDGAGPELEQELIAYCRSKLASLKCPKSIDFKPELPRDPTGKLMKRPLRDSYWPAPA
jgi:acyl-CoA synthetase (AMP-forming)/AMP-acid ligase II